MPASPREATGLGRIEMLQRAVARGDFHTFDDVRALDGEAFTRSRSDPYAWSWGMCQFLGTHPRYADRFRKLHAHIRDGDFHRTFREQFPAEDRECAWEW